MRLPHVYQNIHENVLEIWQNKLHFFVRNHSTNNETDNYQGLQIYNSYITVQNQIATGNKFFHLCILAYCFVACIALLDSLKFDKKLHIIWHQ